MSHATPSAEPVPRTALKLKEVAVSLGVTPLTVRNLIARGLLKPNRSLRHIIIPMSEITRFLTEQ